jgi:hypothetical protein
MSFPISLGGLFLIYASLIAAAVAAFLLIAFRGRAASLAIACLSLWLGYAASFSYLGLLRDPALRPPGVLLMVGPILAVLVLFAGRSQAGLRLATSLPLALLIGFQFFRTGVEWTIHQLYLAGLAPRLMTLEGGNVEFVVAFSAPVVAWLSTRGALGRRLALGWNVVGLLSLANVVARAALSSPGPLNLIHTEIPNLGFGFFPFGLIPGFMVPLAVATHVLTFRALRAAGRDQTDTLAGRTMTTAN